MTEQLIPALITGAVLAMMFPTTRNMCILASSALAYIYPVPVLTVLMITAIIYIWKKIFSK